MQTSLRLINIRFYFLFHPAIYRRYKCPIWVKSRHVQRKMAIRFTPNSDIDCVFGMSALGPKADMGQVR